MNSVKLGNALRMVLFAMSVCTLMLNARSSVFAEAAGEPSNLPIISDQLAVVDGPTIPFVAMDYRDRSIQKNGGAGERSPLGEATSAAQPLMLLAFESNQTASVDISRPFHILTEIAPGSMPFSSQAGLPPPGEVLVKPPEEPSTAAMLAIGLALVLIVRRNRRLLRG